MSAQESNQGSRAAYDYWLGLISQFLGQLGGSSAAAAATVPEALPFPVDQVARAAAMTERSLQGLLQALSPALQAGVPNLFAQWATASFPVATPKPEDGAAANPQTMFAPWLAFMSNAAAYTPTASFFASPANVMPQAPLQAASQAWVDMTSRLVGASPAQLDAAFDRTYGALSDGIGLGPVRKLNAAWRDAVSAAVAQQDARTHYASSLQGAYILGFQRFLGVLSAKADAGERIESVLALIRMWSINTEQAVHETLQSEGGMAATAALIRSDLVCRKNMQQVASVLADQFDIASRRDVDDAFREIQALKRELRAMQAAKSDNLAAVKRAPARRTGTRKKRAL